jgi:hypothetical protein
VFFFHLSFIVLDNSFTELSESRLTSKVVMPTFSVSYTVRSDGTPGTGDYNELAIVTTEFLDRTFEAAFSAAPTSHAFSAIETYRVREETLIEFDAAGHFYIPGNVPFPVLLYTTLEDCFATDCLDNYLSELQSMSDTNPFSKTTAVKFMGSNREQSIEGSPQSPSGPKSPSTPKVEVKRNMRVILIILAGVGCCLLAALGFLWVYRSQTNRNRTVSKAGARLQRTRTADEGTSVSESVYGTGCYGNDDGTGDLDSVGAQTQRVGTRVAQEDLEDISLEDAYTDHISPDITPYKKGDDQAKRPKTFNMKEYEDYLARFDIDDGNALVMPSLHKESGHSSNNAGNESEGAEDCESEEWAAVQPELDTWVDDRQACQVDLKISSDRRPWRVKQSSSAAPATSTLFDIDFDEPVLSTEPNSQAPSNDFTGTKSGLDSASLGLQSELHELTDAPLCGDVSLPMTTSANSAASGEGQLEHAHSEVTPATAVPGVGALEKELVSESIVANESDKASDDSTSLAMGIIGDTYNYLQAISDEFDEEDLIGG